MVESLVFPSQWILLVSHSFWLVAAVMNYVHRLSHNQKNDLPKERETVLSRSFDQAHSLLALRAGPRSRTVERASLYQRLGQIQQFLDAPCRRL